MKTRSSPRKSGLSPISIIMIGLFCAGLIMLFLNFRYRFTTLLKPVTSYTPMPEVEPKIETGEVDQAEMVFIPGGIFLMGSHEDEKYAYQNETPQHTVNLKAFWIDRYEVTNRQYEACVNAGICDAPHAFGMQKLNSMTRVQYFQNPEFANYPVVYVNWFDAQIYCNWVGRRLPTEAEWEKAARGTDGRRYPWGNRNVTGKMANLADRNTDYDWSFRLVNDGYYDTAPVGTFPEGASPYGALDMAGNVWEWVSDWYAEDYYIDPPEFNPQGPEQGEYRSLKGGCWQSSNWGIRAALRSRLKPANAYSYVGFRCAVDDR